MAVSEQRSIHAWYTAFREFSLSWPTVAAVSPGFSTKSSGNLLAVTVRLHKENSECLSLRLASSKSTCRIVPSCHAANDFPAPEGATTRNNGLSSPSIRSSSRQASFLDIGGVSCPKTSFHSHPSSSSVPSAFDCTGTLPPCVLASLKKLARTISAVTPNLVSPDNPAACRVCSVMAGGITTPPPPDS